MAVQRERRAARWLDRGAGLRLACAMACVLMLMYAPLRGQDPAESFDALYAKGQKINASIRTMTANFTETTESALLTKPLVARGTLAVERPSRVVLHYTVPDARTVLIDKNRMTVTWPERQSFDVGAAMSRVQRMFVEGSVKDLRQQFDIDDRAPNDRPGTHHVRLTPRQRRIREGLTSLELWVDRQTSLLSAMRMEFPNGDTKTMTFEHVVANAAIPPDTFTLNR